MREVVALAGMFFIALNIGIVIAGLVNHEPGAILLGMFGIGFNVVLLRKFNG